MEWTWSKANEKSLAQFITDQAVNLLKLPESHFDLVQNPEGRRKLIEVIYQTLIEKKIYYAWEKYNPDDAIQRIRKPNEILSSPGEGTCLDLALLFCGICLGYDLLPLLIIIKHHALVAVSLNHQRKEWNGYGSERNLFNQQELFAGEQNLEKLRKLVSDGAYIAIECTGFANTKSFRGVQPEEIERTEDGFLTFERAEKAGSEQLNNKDRPFKYAIDIAVAHYSWKIKSEIALSPEEINTVGLINPNQYLQVIKERLRIVPNLFQTGLCKGRLLSPSPNEYFVSHGFPPDLLNDWRNTLEKTFTQANGNGESPTPYFYGDKLEGGYRLCSICEKLYTTRFSMFLLPSSQDRNVYFELGIAIGLGAPFFLIQAQNADIPTILEGLNRYIGGSFRTIRRELAGKIQEYDFGVVRFTTDLPPASSEAKYLIAAGGYEDEDFEGTITDTLSSIYPHLEAIPLAEALGVSSGANTMLQQLVESIQTSRFAIYRVDEECSATSFLALGISIGLNKPFLMMHKSNGTVPLDLRGMSMYNFSNFSTLEKEIIPKHKNFFENNTK